jgi:UDP-glucose 4-epimerase
MLAVEVNLRGTVQVLEACKRLSVPLVNISVGNYWMRNPYAITKFAAEQLALMYAEHHRAAVAVVRGLNAYGPRQEPAVPYGSSKVRKLVPALIARAVEGQPMQVYGDGTQVMDMIYVADLARILVEVAVLQLGGARFPDVVEAGSGLRTTVLDVAGYVNQALAAAGREPAPIQHLPMRPGEPEHAEVLADTTTLTTLGLGYEPDTMLPLDRGIAETVRWFLENPR